MKDDGRERKCVCVCVCLHARMHASTQMHVCNTSRRFVCQCACVWILDMNCFFLFTAHNVAIAYSSIMCASLCIGMAKHT